MGEKPRRRHAIMAEEQKPDDPKFEEPMRQILPHSLWLGHARDAQDFKRVFDLGISALVQLAVEEPALQQPRELICCRFPLVDGPGNEIVVLNLAITTLANLLEQKVPTLVTCGAGLSRSPPSPPLLCLWFFRSFPMTA